MAETPEKIPLETHETRSVDGLRVNGALTVVWRDWDKVIRHPPRMVYVTSVDRGEIKGPHLHLRRNSYFLCIRGKVVFVIRQDGRYVEIESGESDPAMVYVPKNFASAHINVSEGPSSVLALADVAWRPDDNEMQNVEFDSYDWSKWLGKRG